jgi:hypothetical protein
MTAYSASSYNRTVDIPSRRPRRAVFLSDGERFSYMYNFAVLYLKESLNGTPL